MVDRGETNSVRADGDTGGASCYCLRHESITWETLNHLPALKRNSLTRQLS